MQTDAKAAAPKEQASSGISLRAFILVACVLLAILLLSGSLSYFIPQGEFLRDEGGNIIPETYQAGQIEGISFWKVLSAPVRVFASEDALKGYAVHPDHVAVATGKVRPHAKIRSCFDFEV